MGRPISTNPRRQQLNLSLTDTELERVRQRAAAAGMRPAHFGRALILNEKVSAPSVETNYSRLIYQQLARLGNNLNQIARYLHRTGAPLPTGLAPLLDDIRRVIAKVQK